MGYTIAPAARALLNQADLAFPGRSDASDGIVGDAAHRRSRSYHNPSDPYGNPDPDGVVRAVDLTHDPEDGCDAHRIVRDAVRRRDPRVLEAISNGQIWTRARSAEGWRTYSGSNPHDKHAHISITWEHRNDTSPWFAVEDAKDDDDKEEDAEMNAEEWKRLETLVKGVEDRLRKRVDEHAVTILRGPNHPSLTKILDAVTDADKV